jgi:hypothetical protein
VVENVRVKSKTGNLLDTKAKATAINSLNLPLIANSSKQSDESLYQPRMTGQLSADGSLKVILFQTTSSHTFILSVPVWAFIDSSKKGFQQRYRA